jgi:hypothetical protein
LSDVHQSDGRKSRRRLLWFAPLLLLALLGGIQYARWHNAVAQAHRVAEVEIVRQVWRELGRNRPMRAIAYPAHVYASRRTVSPLPGGQYELLETLVWARWTVLPGSSWTYEFPVRARGLRLVKSGGDAPPFVRL